MPKDTTPQPENQTPEAKSSQQGLLLVLLLLVALFGYLYFFTGLIRPRPESPHQEQQAQTVVKKPLPPRPQEDSAAAGEASPGKEEKAGANEQAAGDAAAKAAKPAKEEKVAQAAEEKKPAPEKAKPAKEQKVVKAPANDEKVAKQPAKEEKPKAPQPEKAKAANDEKGAKAAKHEKGAQHKEAKVAGAAAGEKAVKASKEDKGAKAAKLDKEPKAAEAKAAKAKGGAGKEATVAATGPKGATAKAAKSATGEGKEAEAGKGSAPRKAASAASKGGWTLEVAGDLVEGEVGPVAAKLKKAGVTRIEKTKVKKGETMHRLFLADFANHDEAAEELLRLRENAPNAFMLNENGRYAIYAGSYLREKKAALEQDRLYDKGVKLLLRQATAPVSVVKVRAGSFRDQASAEQAARQLRKAGVEAKVVKAAKQPQP